MGSNTLPNLGDTPVIVVPLAVTTLADVSIEIIKNATAPTVAELIGGWFGVPSTALIGLEKRSAVFSDGTSGNHALQKHSTVSDITGDMTAKLYTVAPTTGGGSIECNYTFTALANATTNIATLLPVARPLVLEAGKTLVLRCGSAIALRGNLLFAIRQMTPA